MIDKNYKEAKHSQGIKMEGYKAPQIIHHNMLFHERIMDREKIPETKPTSLNLYISSTNYLSIYQTSFTLLE